MWPFTEEPDECLFNYYEEGREAYKNGLEMWQCPYVDITSPVAALGIWMAGWMYEKQWDMKKKLEK